MCCRCGTEGVDLQLRWAPLRAFWSAIFLLCCIAAYGADDSALLEIPQQTGLVVDLAHTLSEDQKHSLESRLKSLQDSGRAQAAVLLIPKAGLESLAEFALRVAENWKLGKAGVDNGLLIVLSPTQGAARLEVGYGLEGLVTDALASQWLNELVPALKAGKVAEGLDGLLDKLDATLPANTVTTPKAANVLDRHPEWKLPFVLAVFAPFALFPLFFGRWGALASAPLLAGFLAGAAWSLWHSKSAAIAIAAGVFPLPLLWTLNWFDDFKLTTWLRWARALGNGAAVAMFFSWITLFVGMGLSVAEVKETWAAPMFSGMLAIGLAVFLFPGIPARILMIVLRSFVHFAFSLLVFYLALHPFVERLTLISFALAALFTALVALGLYMDWRVSRDPALSRKWASLPIALALVLIAPCGLLLLIQAVLGDEMQSRLMQAAAGGGSLAAFLWWLARQGLLASLNIGLGGRFGGGGTGRGE